MCQSTIRSCTHLQSKSVVGKFLHRKWQSSFYLVISCLGDYIWWMKTLHPDIRGRLKFVIQKCTDKSYHNIKKRRCIPQCINIDVTFHRHPSITSILWCCHLILDKRTSLTSTKLNLRHVNSFSRTFEPVAQSYRASNICTNIPIFLHFIYIPIQSGSAIISYIFQCRLNFLTTLISNMSIAKSVAIKKTMIFIELMCKHMEIKSWESQHATKIQNFVGTIWNQDLALAGDGLLHASC